MSFQQVYYTSCATGLRGARGFQVNAATPGIPPPTLQQVERLGIYVPPVSAPLRPTPDQIAVLPVNLLYSRLADQTAVLLQSRYTGADYSGRFGNYFAHSLVTTRPDEDFPGLPIELWRSPTWNTAESAGTALPSLDTATESGEINPGTVLGFLQAGDHMGHLPLFLTAVEQALKTRRRVIVVDHCDAVALWIAAAAYALPRHHALRLTFSTYLKNPYQSDALVTGTSPDGDFRFAPHEMDRQFYVFDFLGRRFTRIPETTEYARMVAELYARGCAEDVADFSRTGTRKVPPTVGLDELAPAFAFHSLASGQRPSGVQDASVLKWAANHLAGLDPSSLEAMLQALLSAPAVGPEGVEACTDLVVSAGKLPGVRDRLERPYARWLVEHLAQTATGTQLLAVAARVDFSPATRATLAPYRMAWRQRLCATRDPVLLAGLIVLGVRADYFHSDGIDLSDLAGTALAPRLDHPQVRAAVSTVFSHPGHEGLQRAITGWLAEHETETIAVAVTDDPELSMVFEASALEMERVGLLIRLTGARTQRVRGDRWKALQSLAETLATRGIKMDGPLSQAIESLWGDAPWSLREALEIVQSGRFSPAQMARSGVASRAAAALALGEVFKRDPTRDQLAQALATEEMAASLDDRALDLVQAHLAAAAIHRGGKDLVPGLRSALAFCHQLEGSSRTGLFDLAARRLVDVTEIEAVTTVLGDLLAEWPDRAVQVYGHEVEAAMAPGRGGAAELGGRVFTACTLLVLDIKVSSRTVQAVKRIRDERLARAARARKGLMDQMNDFVATPGQNGIALETAWEQWRKEHRPRWLG